MNKVECKTCYGTGNCPCGATDCGPPYCKSKRCPDCYCDSCSESGKELIAVGVTTTVKVCEDCLPR